MMSFAVTPGSQRAVHANGEGLGRPLQQALRREHVLHFAGADAERQRAERSVRGRVAVAANYRHARLGQSQLRPDHVHDALAVARKAVAFDAEIAAILFQPLDLRRGYFVENRQALGVVGVEWSVVAMVRSGRRTFNPRRRRPSNACGEVTSWTRCRSI